MFGDLEPPRALCRFSGASGIARGLAERDSRVAPVLNVPVEVCPACCQVWLSMSVAKDLDEVFNKLLASGAESAQVHWTTPSLREPGTVICSSAPSRRYGRDWSSC